MIQHRKSLRCQGFTFVETMIVLMIFMIVISITAFHIKPQFQTIDKQFFLTQLSNDLYYAQLYAIANQAEVFVNFSQEQHFYYFRISGGKELFRRKYSEDIEVLEGSLRLSFSFLPSGNINKFGSFSIKIGNDKYKFTTLLGKGRFYIVKKT